MARIEIDIVGKDAASPAFKKANDAVNKLGQSAKNTSTVLGGATVKASNEAGLALTNFGRIAQDLPYGFIGIQNNLNPMLESFQRLSKETGSSTSALKAMVSSLMGPAGIGIALSVASSAFLLYQQYVQKTAKETENAKNATDQYVASLSNIEKARVIGAQNAAKELVDLRLLYETTQNLSLSYDQRKKAVDELQSQYPAYFKNISDEKILAGEATAQYKQLSDAILATGRARAAAEIITEKEKRRFENIQKINDLQKEELVLQEKLTKARQIDNGPDDSFSALNVINELNSKIAENKNLQRNYASDILLIDKQTLELSKEIVKQQQKGADLTGKVGGIDEKTIKTLKNNLLDGRKAFTDFFGETERAYQSFVKTVQGNDSIFGGKTYTNELTKQFQSTNTELSNFAENWKITASKLGSTPLISIESFKTGATQFLSDAQKFTNALNEILVKGVEAGANDFGMAIGNALANGENIVNAATGSILSSIGDIIIQFGKLTIAAGVASTALGQALKNPWNPGSGIAAIAAGVALVAIGAAVRGFGANIGRGESSGSSTRGESNRYRPPGFASGVTNFEGGLAYVHAGELLTNLPTGANVIPKAKTNQILSGIGGGGNSWEVAGVLKGTDIELAVRRSVKNNNLI